MIEIRGLTFYYGARCVLDNLDLAVADGKITALLGPNGSGKTTLFRILSTLLPAPKDTIFVDGFERSTGERDIRRRIGVLFQHAALDPKLRVIENLRCAGHLHGMRGRPLEDAIKKWATAAGIADRLRDFVGELSGGLRRRVEIAKALLPEPKLLLLDEPSTGLDPSARAACRGIFRSLAQQGITLFLTTHLMEEAAEADVVLLLHRGRIVAQGAPQELCEKLGSYVLHVRTASPEDVRKWLRSAEPDARAIHEPPNGLRIFSCRANSLAKQLPEVFRQKIDSITLARPSLEDVFAHHTGISMAEADSLSEEEKINRKNSGSAA